MFHWGSAPPKRLKTTGLDSRNKFALDFTEKAEINRFPSKLEVLTAMAVI